MVKAQVRKAYTEISHVLLTLHGKFNSMADLGA